MNVLVVMPRYASTNKPNYRYGFPLGLGYIVAALKRAGHEVHGLNLNHTGGRVQDIVGKSLEHFPCDYVCTGATSDYYGAVHAIVASVRAATPAAKVILGGGLMTSEPIRMFEVIKPDFAVLGEGDATVVELLACLRDGGDIGAVRGIAYRDPEGRIQMTPAHPAVTDLDALPWPDFGAFDYPLTLDHSRPTDTILNYVNDAPRVYPILGSRSCPYRCTFCFHPLGNTYRERSVRSILDELEAQIPKYRINIVSLYDELFSRHAERVREFCEGMQKLRARLDWDCVWTCGIRVCDVEPDLLRLMKAAGCYLIGYGFESYSETILKSMRKGTTPAQIDRAVRLTLEAEISILGNFIFGDLAETPETARTTLAYWAQNAAAAINLNFIKSYPGTHIYQRSLERGVIRDPLKYIEDGLPIINCTETMTDAQFDDLVGEVMLAKLRHNRLAFPTACRNNDRGTCDITVRCPWCRETVEYRNCSEVRMFTSYDFHCRRCHHHFFLVSRRGFAVSRLLNMLLAYMPHKTGWYVFGIGRGIQARMTDG